MNAELQLRIKNRVGSEVRQFKMISGGDAALAFRVEFQDAPAAFLKTVSGGNPFRMEALGLKRFICPQGMRVPEVWAVEDDFLLLEWIDFTAPPAGSQAQMGESLAHTHQQCLGDDYGFDEDHTIGVTPQKNIPLVKVQSGSWAEFWWSHRLEPMLKRLGDESLSSKGRRLSDRLDSLLPDPQGPPALLHGDLWSGNVGVDTSNQPIMFDPAPYYGHPEADLGMTRMFGGFDQNFYDAYTRTFPLLTGWEERLELYMLYHVLNHACIYGGGYRIQADRIINHYI